MKRIVVTLVLFLFLLDIQPAHSQAACNPPVNAPQQSISAYGDFVAWSYGGTELAYQKCGEFHVTIYQASNVVGLFFDGYWLPYNLYWQTADGGSYQLNVATGDFYVITQPNTPAGDEGGHHGEAISESAPMVAPETQTPPARRYVKPEVVIPFGGEWWLFLIGW
jgi:hypothetical protein